MQQLRQNLGGEVLSEGKPTMLQSWRKPGQLWELREDGEGERLSLRNSCGDAVLEDLTDGDLSQIQELLAAAINHRARRPEPYGS